MDYNFIRPFYSEGDFYLKYLGYNDFEKVVPIKRPRVQDFYTLHYVLGGSGKLDAGGTFYKVRAGQLFFCRRRSRSCIILMKLHPGNMFGLPLMVQKQRNMEKDGVFRLKRRIGRAPAGGQVPSACSGSSAVCWQRTVTGTLWRFLLFMKSCIYAGAGSLCGAPRRLKSSSINKFCFPGFYCGAALPQPAYQPRPALPDFQGGYGVTAVKYLISCRLALAARLLETTQLPIKTVAIPAALMIRSIFTKSFKKSLRNVGPGIPNASY
ncbi:MAG: AraC family ligand binding domain-containing protein [Lachnoclostridium sp.]